MYIYIYIYCWIQSLISLHGEMQVHFWKRKPITIHVFLNIHVFVGLKQWIFIFCEYSFCLEQVNIRLFVFCEYSFFSRPQTMNIHFLMDIHLLEQLNIHFCSEYSLLLENGYSSNSEQSLLLKNEYSLFEASTNEYSLFEASTS